MNSPSVGVTTYTVYTNKDGSRWIKGNNIIKYYSNCPNKIPTRLFLSENVISQIDDFEW